MARVMQAYRFALDPTPRQQGQLASHTGAARFAFNWGLALVKTGRVPWSGVIEGVVNLSDGVRAGR
jgi:hypothetical protein